MIRQVYETFMKNEPRTFWQNWFDSRFYIAYLISKLNSELVLDIGCGTGVLVHFTNAKHKIGIDYSFSSLQSAKKLEPKADFICCDVTSLPFRNDIFPNILAVQIFQDLKGLGQDWERAILETKRVAGKNCQIILNGNNKMSRHFNFKGYAIEERSSYLNYLQQAEFFKNDYEIEVEGYDPHPKWLMFGLKKILFNIPDIINEKIFEKSLFNFLRSKRYLKNGRSFIMICKRRS